MDGVAPTAGRLEARVRAPDCRAMSTHDPSEPSRRSSAGGRCPICGKPTAAETRPFCSRRCADVDLGRWLGGRYAIPTAEPPDPDDLGRAGQDPGGDGRER